MDAGGATDGSRVRALGGAFFLLLATSCATLHPIDYGPNGRITDPQIALRSIQARRDHVQTVRGEAKASIESPQGNGSFSVLAVAKPPLQVRLETVSFFGNPIAVLTSNGMKYALNDLEHHHFDQGLATAENVSKLLPAPFDPANLVSLIVGVPPPFTADKSQLEVDEFKQCYVLTLIRGNARQVVGIDPATLRPLWVRMNKDAAWTPFEAKFDEYAGEADLPTRISVTTEEPKTKVDLHWRDREVNAPIDPEVFVQQEPAK